MADNIKTPLGFVSLTNGAKAIYPMNDIFLNYAFEDPANWEALRLTINILLYAYKQKYPCTTVEMIEGNIKVRTQFRHLLETDIKTTRNQDFEIIEDDENITFIEFQNRAQTHPPIEIRSVEYFGLGISRNRGKQANQIWLLAEDLKSVLNGKVFARYILKDEATNYVHPATSGIMYVSLLKLSKEKGPAGELASFLLGKTTDPKDDSVKKIAEALKTCFNDFKTNKDVVKMLTLAERYLDEGEARGISIGEARGAKKLAELIKSGLSPDEALNKLNEEKHELTD